MSKEPEDSDLLVPFELANITGDYRKYYIVKRNNFFASIQGFPDLWDFFCNIDEIWRRELEDLEVGGDSTRVLPLVLYMQAHAKMRVSMELAFSQCIQEARSVLRDAVECVAHGHHVLRDLANLKAWQEKDEPGGLKAFEAAFVKNKKTVLFKGIEELHEKYGQLSEAGSHPTWQSFTGRLSFNKAAGAHSMRVHYSGMPDRDLFAKELFSRLLTCFVMERTLCEDFKLRLQLDGRLVRMRDDFEVFKEELRKRMIVQYKMRRPITKPAP
jgi:hypothetical protein